MLLLHMLAHPGQIVHAFAHAVKETGGGSGHTWQANELSSLMPLISARPIESVYQAGISNGYTRQAYQEGTPGRHIKREHQARLFSHSSVSL
jgi:hypothetical protein